MIQDVAAKRPCFPALSVQIQPEKWQTKIKQGWRKVAEIPGDEVAARKFLIRFLARPDGRQMNISPTPILIVLENPAPASSMATGVD